MRASESTGGTTIATSAAKAVLLGLVQGPAEMAPVSSSAHISLLRRLIEGEPPEGRRLEGVAAAERKSIDVALHGAGAIAIATALAGGLRQAWPRMAAGRREAIVAVAVAVPSLVGLLLERPIERRLGEPGSIAAGLVGGALAMAAADRRPQERSLEQAGVRDGVALGIAQALALSPGVSRRGAALSAARMRRFNRNDAEWLSWIVGLPVIAAASTLKAARLLGAAKTARPPAGAMTAGAGAAFASTLASARLLAGRRGGSLLAFSAYRVTLAFLIVGRRRRHLLS